MSFGMYFVFFLLRGTVFGSAIKFSAESFAEITLLAEKGKTHLESLREKANIPQFGPCWNNAISDLQIGCKFLSENVQSDLALKFTDCFLQMSGHEPLNCDLPKTICLKKLSDRAFNAYTEFYTHTQSICYFLQSQRWHEETEKTIDKLSTASQQLSQKLEEAGEVQEKLLSQQKESLTLQRDLNDNSKNVASVLQLSQDKINVFMKDFKISATEQRKLLQDLFENLVLFRAWAANELSWFSSTVYFTTVIILSFLFTSVSRTREARIHMLILFAFNYFLERIISSSDSIGYYLTVTPDSLEVWIWSCRKFFICLAFSLLLYTAFSYYDYNLCNYKLLLEIKNQNLEILNYFAMNAKNQNSFSPHSINKFSNNLNHFNNISESWRCNTNKSSTLSENNTANLCNCYNQQSYSNLAPINSSSVYSFDVVDCEKNETLENVTVTNEKKRAIKEKMYSYNLRNHRSKRLTLD